MNLYLRIACGFIVLPHEDGYGIGGSCFAFRDRHHVLTAAHCIPDGGEALVYLPGHKEGEPFPVRPVANVDRHPRLDVALITLPEREDETLGDHVINNVSDMFHSEEADFLAFGYPVVTGAEGPTPVARTMKGHVQRYFMYDGSSGPDFLAAEMSIPAPAGSSGGPIVSPHDKQTLVGIIVANHDSYAVTDSVDEVDADGQRMRIESQRIVSYGIAVPGASIRHWLADLGM